MARIFSVRVCVSAVSASLAMDVPCDGSYVSV